MGLAPPSVGLRGWRRLLAAVSSAEEHPLHLGLIVSLLLLGVALHYGDQLPLLSTAADHSPIGLTTRQSLERLLFLVPVIYATLVFRARGGVAALAVAGAILFPRAIASESHTDHALPEAAGVMVVGGLLVLVITQQRWEVGAQKRTRDSLRYLVRQILGAQEEERRRIALELHDETAQALLLTCQRLDGLTSADGPQLPHEVKAELQDLRESTVHTLADLRRLTQNLRPRILDDHGLAAALAWLADHLLEQYGIEAQVQVDEAAPDYAPDVQLLLFRVAQEALHNVARHSGATRAAISLEGDDGRVRMSITDNGAGFRLTDMSELARKGKLGLLGMQERIQMLGGSLQIRSTPGRGTTIKVEVPARATSPVSSSAPAATPSGS
ncbi:MAG TPA: sensor histidine kinase [Dehalococcoidia bacterium]|nr:sensor histidine kinase [Dehalococcoidia bacterium]